MHDGYRWAALTSIVCWLFLFQQPALAQLTNPPQWAATDFVDHELVGRIWSTAGQIFVEPEALSVDLRDARYLLLGEKHDNPDHHQLQRQVLQVLIDSQQLHSVTFEMMTSTVRERLIDLYLQEPMSLAELEAYLMWDSAGWDWNHYGPLVQTVYEARLPLVAGNITRDTVNAIYANGDTTPGDALDESALAQLQLDIDESHCGMLPESQFPAMVRVQQARDRALARNLRNPGEDQTSVLIAGNYHIRQDLGVPNYLLRLQPNLPRQQIVALAFMEVEAGEVEPTSYQQQFGDQAAFDYIWFTPSVGEQDYCASLEQ